MKYLATTEKSLCMTHCFHGSFSKRKQAGNGSSRRHIYGSTKYVKFWGKMEKNEGKLKPYCRNFENVIS